MTGASSTASDGGGGGIFAGVSATLLYSTVSNNTAGNEFSAGGGVYAPTIIVKDSTRPATAPVMPVVPLLR